MKRFFLPMTAVLLFVACDKNETESEITPADASAVKAAMATGQWEISYYSDSDIDETTDFDGFIFSFIDTGVLSVTDGSSSLSGAWSVTDSDSNDDSTIGSDLDFNILFNGSELFEELSDDWEIVKYSNTKIELLDVSGGDGSTDYLTFEKL